MGAAGAVAGGVVVPKVVEAAVKGVPAVGRAVRAAVEPLTEKGRATIAGRTLVNAAGDEAPTVAQRLAQAGELVPGSMPTAAQVAENGGIAALERSVSAAQPAEFTRAAWSRRRRAPARSATLRATRPRARPRWPRAGATKDLYSRPRAPGTRWTSSCSGCSRRRPCSRRWAGQDAGREQPAPVHLRGAGPRRHGGLGNRRAGGSKQITGQGLQDLKMAWTHAVRPGLRLRRHEAA
jgi:hypothetical protein